MVGMTSLTALNLLSTAIFLSAFTSRMCHQHRFTLSLFPKFIQTNLMSAGKHKHIYSREKCNSLKDMWRSFIHGISFHRLRTAQSAVKTAPCSDELVYQYFW